MSTLLAVLAGLGFALLAAFLWRTAGVADTSQYGTTFNPPSYSSPAAAATSPSAAASSPAPQPSPTASTEPEDGSDAGGGDG